MRVLSVPEATVLRGKQVPLAVLVEIGPTEAELPEERLAIPIYLTTAGIDLRIGGISYLGTRGLGTIEAVRTTASEIAELRFELPGVPLTQVALAESEEVQGKAVQLKLAMFDPMANYQHVGTRLFWAGRLDTMEIVEGPADAVIQATAEHDGIELLRPQISLYTDAEQQRLFPGDPFFQYVAAQVDQRIVWPAASWGRQ